MKGQLRRRLTGHRAIEHHCIYCQPFAGQDFAHREPASRRRNYVPGCLKDLDENGEHVDVIVYHKDMQCQCGRPAQCRTPNCLPPLGSLINE